MTEGVCESAAATGLIGAESFDAGLRALRRTTAADGASCYTFFKGVGRSAGAGR
jgi:hypothetical protein